MTSVQRDNRRADRIRAAICLTLAARPDVSRSIDELVAAVRALGIPLGEGANKIVGDAIRWELRRGRVRKTARGWYAAGRIPRTTLYYMRVRVAAYAEDPSKAYSRPGLPVTTPAAPEAPGALVAGGASDDADDPDLPDLPDLPDRFGIAGLGGAPISARLAAWDAARPRVLPPRPGGDSPAG